MNDDEAHKTDRRAPDVFTSIPPEPLPCVHCHAQNAPDARFCEGCGSALAHPDAATLIFDPGEARDRGQGSASGEAGPTGTPGTALFLTSTLAGQAPDVLLQLARRELADDYDVEREVGRGGMAVVFRAIELQLRRPVALKVLPPELALGAAVVERFKREAQMAAALDHPNIIPIYRVGQTASLLYLAMKYVEGRPLDSIVASQGALPIAVVVLVLRAAASALAFAHEHKIVHRDIKGGNILVDRQGRAIVTDFGVARAIENASMTTTGSVIGTPYFMSPEQCAGKPAIPQSDQYSLGVVAFQMLIGAVPFQADTLAAIMHHHFFTAPPDVTAARPDAPAALTAVLTRMLAKDPERRYAHTRDLLASLEAIALTDAERADGEAMLRSLASGTNVPSVQTGVLPPLADTMSAVMAHDAFMRSAGRARRVGRRVGAGFIVALVCAIGLWIWQRPRGEQSGEVARRGPSATGALPSTTASASGPLAVGGAGSPGGPTSGGVTGDSNRTSGGDTVSAGRRSGQHLRRHVAGPVGASQTPGDTLMARGKLRLRVVPSEAEIFIDGRDVGQGVVFDLDVIAGERKLHVSAPGYAEFDTLVVVQAGETTQLNRVVLKGAGDQ